MPPDAGPIWVGMSEPDSALGEVASGRVACGRHLPQAAVGLVVVVIQFPSLEPPSRRGSYDVRHHRRLSGAEIQHREDAAERHFPGYLVVGRPVTRTFTRVADACAHDVADRWVCTVV